MKSKKTIKPNLFIVGMPKAGTTSLYHYLNEHPEIFMSPDKEPSFFSEDIKRKKYREEREYLELFRNSNENIRGEASTYYILSDVAPEKIKKFNPRAKIIISLRGPISYINSIHNKQLMKKKELNLYSKLKSELGLSKKEKEKILHDRGYGEIYLYGLKKAYSNVSKFVKVFGEKNVKIITANGLESTPEKTYKEVLDFLEVEEKNFLPKFRSYNAFGTTKSKIFFRAYKSIKKKMPKISKVLIEKVPVKTRGKIVELNRRKKKKIEMDKDSKEIIVNEISPYIKNSEEIPNNLLKR